MQRFKLERRFILAIGVGVAAGVLLLTLIFNKNGIPLLMRSGEPDIVISTGSVKEGEFLAKILSARTIPDPFINQIQKNFFKVYEKKHIMPGDLYQIITSTSGLFQKMIYRSSPTKYYDVVRSTSGAFTSHSYEKQTVWVEQVIKGKISEFMWRDLHKMGFDENFVANLMGDLGDNIFAWRIDFFTEQRVGDEFDVLIERECLVGENRPTNNLHILAAYYKGSGTRPKENYAVRFQPPGADKPDYYDLEGQAVRKEFLRAPFSHRGFRITSGFSTHRFHPILRVWRPHHGTDYGAPIGTPVVSIGNGTVVFAGWKGGYGNCIDIRHSHKFSSRYGHLSKIRVRVGQKVSQGNVIGYSGSTGASTGPHLHFEMQVDGVQRNFLALNFSPAKSVEAKDMPEFKLEKNQLLARLLPVSSNDPSSKAATTAK